MAKHTKKQAKEVEKATKQLEDLDSLKDGENIADMTPDQLERKVKAFSDEGLKLRRARKEVRYQLYRLRTDAEGKNSHESTKTFIKKFEDQPYFDGWRNFGTTWDVAQDDPYRIVHKTLSEQEEWDEVVRSKFPQIDHNGKVTYPDITVRKRVEHESAKRDKKKKG
jgi:hypothetical protein